MPVIIPFSASNFLLYSQVKRLTMGLLKTTEDSRPLVQHNTSLSRVSQDGYVNEGIIGDHLTSTFGDSCRDSLNPFKTLASQQLAANNTTGFDYKRNVFHSESQPGKCISFIPHCVYYGIPLASSRLSRVENTKFNIFNSRIAQQKCNEKQNIMNRNIMIPAVVDDVNKTFHFFVG